MKILITSNTGVQHKYLWSKIIETKHEVFIFAQTHLAQNSTATNNGISVRLKRIIQNYSKNTLYNLEMKRTNAFFNKDEKDKSHQYFEYEKTRIDEVKAAGRYFEYNNINSAESVENIKRIKPDLIVVQGGRILSNLFFENSRLGTIHLHGGIVPWYRGGTTWFANFVNNDLYYIGPTIQEIDSGIDTGNLIHQHTLKVEKGDTPFSLYAKTCVVGVEILLKCIEELSLTDHRLSSFPIPIKGFNYSNKSRKKYEDILVYRKYADTIKEFADSKFNFKPALIQNDKLKVVHPYVLH